MYSSSGNYMKTNGNDQNSEYFAYLRESVDLESGIEIQKEKIKKYCEVYSIKISKWFIENNISAFKHRNEYTKMMNLILSDGNTVDGIICSSLTRYGRRTSEVLADHDRLTDKNKKLILIDTPLDATTAMGRAVLGNMAIFGQLERDLIVERTAAGKEYARRNGTKSGMPMHRPKIEVDWKEYDKYYKLGLSTNAISKIIKDVRTGKPISSGALYNAVRNR